jgi:hypothetical protein
MSIIFADFPSGQLGLYGTNTANMLNGIWAQEIEEGTNATVSLVSDPDPNIAADGVVLYTSRPAAGTAAGRAAMRLAYPTPAQTQGIGCRIWLPYLPVSNSAGPYISFHDAANNVMFAIRIMSTGAIEARSTYIGGSGTQYGVTTGPVVTANAYNHVEVKGFSNAATGTIEVRVNGVVVLALTGLNTNGAAIAQMNIGTYKNNVTGVNTEAYFKDLVFWDTAGSVGNDFQGSVSVRDLYTDADIDLNWTPSTGSTGWDLLDKTSVDDTTYIQAGDPPPDPAVFSLTDLPADVTSVRALLPIYRAVKTDGGDCNLQAGLTPNNTDWDDGADRPVTTAFTFYYDVSELSPDTAAPWTVTEVNDAYVRINRTL